MAACLNLRYGSRPPTQARSIPPIHTSPLLLSPRTPLPLKEENIQDLYFQTPWVDPHPFFRRMSHSHVISYRASIVRMASHTARGRGNFCRLLDKAPYLRLERSGAYMSLLCLYF